MERLGTAECLIFRAPCRFVGYEVGPCPAQSCRADSLVGIHHYMIVSRLFKGILVVIHHPLVVVVVAFGYDVADITALDCVIAVLLHESVCSVKMPFVVARGSGCLMVHYHLHSLVPCISFYFVYIEVRIRGDKVEHIFLHVAEPVLPAYVPSFHEHSVKAVLRSEINVFLHIFRRRPVTPVRFHSRKVIRVEMHAFQVICVGP